MSEIVESIKSEIEELIGRGLEVKQQIEEYREEAISIDEDYKARHPDLDYIPLDDLPYGEEIIRTEDLPVQVAEAIERLESVNLEKDSVTTVVEVIEETRRAIDDAQSTVDDCTDLPTSSPEHEEDFEDEEDEDQEEDEGQ